MSRCFPFPPPGYEIKASAENVNLILKEKHKLKKHKDKKDKDKKEKKERSEKKEKERSEKKENERSEGKRKDGKDRKQKKHKDDKDKKEDKLKSLEEKKIDNFIPDDSKPSNGVEDSRILAELGKRVRNEATDNETVEKKIILVERKHDNNGHTLEVEAKCSRNGFAGYFTGEYQIDRIEKRNEGKEKNENENERNENGNRHKKNENRDKKREEKKRKKERKKEEAKREKKKRKKERKKEKEAKERSKERENDGDVVYSRPSDHLKENGFLHENGFRTHNTSSAAVISSSHDQVANSTKVKLVENGRKPDNKELELKMNGVLEQHKIDNSSMPSLKTKEEKKVRISTKPPHADLKYMSQILTVPKLDFSPQFDDQDWLFGCKDPQSKRPKLDSSHVESHVWAEAIVVGPADFIAMPYVIPY